MVEFPGDFMKGNPQTTSSGGQSLAGAEKYNSIDGNQITCTNIVASSVTSGWVYANSIKASQITSEYISGDRIDVTMLNAKNIQAATVKSDWVYAGNINASQITAGSITVGGSSQPTALIIQHSTNDSNSRLRFEGGSRIWEDTSDNMGLNALGGEFYIYTNSTQRAYFGSSNINLYPATTYVKKINFGFDGQNEGNIDNVDIIRGYNDIRFQIQGGDDFKFLDGDGHQHATIHGDTGRFQSDNSYVTLAGTDKTAILRLLNQYRALYCVESPEVWFFDFCESKDKVDPLFLEATEGEIKFIACDKGYQVWRRRKGHANKRFEIKTAEEFARNEKFLQMAKV